MDELTPNWPKVSTLRHYFIPRYHWIHAFFPPPALPSCLQCLLLPACNVVTVSLTDGFTLLLAVFGLAVASEGAVATVCADATAVDSNKMLWSMLMIHMHLAAVWDPANKMWQLYPHNFATLPFASDSAAASLSCLRLRTLCQYAAVCPSRIGSPLLDARS